MLHSETFSESILISLLLKEILPCICILLGFGPFIYFQLFGRTLAEVNIPVLQVKSTIKAIIEKAIKGLRSVL
jgi:hypothetical protein